MSEDKEKVSSSKIQLAVLLLILVPVALFTSARAYNAYSRVVKSEQLFSQAQVKMDARDWAAALGLLQQCTDTNPVYYPAYEAQAVIYWDEMKDQKATADVLERAVTNCKEDPRASHLYALYMIQHLKDPRRAADHLKIAAQTFPEDVTIRNLLKAAENGSANGKGAAPASAPPPSPAASGAPAAAPAPSTAPVGHSGTAAPGGSPK